MYNSSWRLDDESSKWIYNKILFNTTNAFKYWMCQCMEKGYVLGRTMGDKSVHGVVYHFTPQYHPINDKLDLFVLKTVEHNATGFEALLSQLRIEAEIGMTPNAPVPTVFAHRYNKKTRRYEILMQNVIKDTKQLITHNACTLKRYLEYFPKKPQFKLFKEQLKKNPHPNPNLLVKKFHDVLIKFYKTTRHFHGDLHLGNIIVTYKKNDPISIGKIYMIDFGSAMAFPRSLDMSKLKYVSDFMEPISQVFDALNTRDNFNSWEFETHMGDYAWLQGLETSVIHNLKQKANYKNFWQKVLLIGKINSNLSFFLQQ